MKRGRYDRGEIDAEGNEKPPEQPFYHDMDAAGGAGGGGPKLSPEELEELLGAAFAEQLGRRRSRPSRAARRALQPDRRFPRCRQRRGAAADAAGRTHAGRDNSAGLRDGHVLRLKGQGMPGAGAVRAGDALIEVSVAPHRYFRRAGNDVVLELPITLQEAVLGATLEVPTVSGKVRMTIPPHSGNGRRLRLAGRGIAGGNQVVELKLVLPTRERAGAGRVPAKPGTGASRRSAQGH